jgi:phospho-N-acetylmuramoyl-pentapeptide-transferase
LAAFALCIALAPFIIMGLRRLKVGQEILKYVDWHKSKGGTPTMGGWIFIVPLLLISFFVFNKNTPLCLIAICASLSYAVVGFLDDYLKIKHRENLGLRAYQKILGQGGIAILVAVFYYMANPNGRIFVPFLNQTWDMGFWIAPLVFLVLVATTNAVNLTDGLDGLAASVAFWFLIFLFGAIFLVSKIVPVPEIHTFLILIAVACGAILCYLLFNSNKATVFMGDTGSLFLGGFLACVSLFTGLGFFIILLGIMYVSSALSVIIQVVYFKLTHGKRVFLMAPYHHHLEKKGFGEAKIVAIYSTVTIIAGVLCILSLL